MLGLIQRNCEYSEKILALTSDEVIAEVGNILADIVAPWRRERAVINIPDHLIRRELRKLLLDLRGIQRMIVFCLMADICHKGDDVVFETFLKQDQPPGSSVSVPESVHGQNTLIEKLSLA